MKIYLKVLWRLIIGIAIVSSIFIAMGLISDFVAKYYGIGAGLIAGVLVIPVLMIYFIIVTKLKEEEK